MSANLARGPKGRPPRSAALGADLLRVGQSVQEAVLPGLRGQEEDPVAGLIIEPLPLELPRLPSRPRVFQLTDGDCVSHGVAGVTGVGRTSDQEISSCLDKVHATAMLLDPHARIRCAVSAEVATRHLDVLTTARNNLFTIRSGPDGVGQALLEELADLIEARMITTRPGRRRAAWLADLVILVAQDGIYAPPVVQLRLLGIPTWLLVPGHSAAASLRGACCAVSYVGPCRLA